MRSMAGALLVKGGGNKARGSGAGAPGLIIAARGLARTGLERRTVGPDRRGRACRVRHMRQLPWVRLVVFRRRRRVDRVMEPAVPARRGHRGFGDAIIDHPAPLEAERRIDRSAARAVIGVAELIVTDEFALTPRIEERVEGRAVPPGEEPQEKVFDLHESRLPGPSLERGASARRTMKRRMRPVQPNFFETAPKSGLRARPDSSDVVKPCRR